MHNPVQHNYFIASTEIGQTQPSPQKKRSLEEMMASAKTSPILVEYLPFAKKCKLDDSPLINIVHKSNTPLNIRRNIQLSPLQVNPLVNRHNQVLSELFMQQEYKKTCARREKLARYAILAGKKLPEDSYTNKVSCACKSSLDEPCDDSIFIIALNSQPPHASTSTQPNRLIKLQA